MHVPNLKFVQLWLLPSGFHHAFYTRYDTYNQKSPSHSYNSYSTIRVSVSCDHITS